jgi:oxalate decarboxylase/phosphoglucose isomerase-like protein (cupin superfamily)
VVAGRRRFTLFAPEQIGNLYIGPLEPTPAGQAISLVDFANPDFERFPRFAQALEAAEVAEMEPGDALYLPSMWWHHVEALSPVNLLVNAWWSQTPDYVDTPVSALNLALMTLRDLPAKEKKVWQQLFQHYVFDADDSTWAHIPPEARGLLGPVTEAVSRQARTQLLNKLRR